MGACTIPGNFFIVSEFLPRGDVEKMLRDQNIKLSLYTRMKMAKDAALGMNWLHCSNPIFIHRDLKSSNLLIDEHGRVKGTSDDIDFITITVINDSLSSACNLGPNIDFIAQFAILVCLKSSLWARI
jgi:serine/threonine protein kinase